jgi:hypothetical protein
MRRRAILALGGTALTTALAGCSSLGSADGEEPTDTPTDTDDPTPTPTDTDPDVPADLRNGSFEDDWAAWEIGRDLPTDPNAAAERAVASEVTITTRNTVGPGRTAETTDGVTSLRLFIDGSQDDGTVWVQQPVDLSGHDYLAVDYRVSRSFNEILQAAVYAGPAVEGGLSEADFDRSNSLAGHEGEGWKTFVYEVDHDGPGVVAVGTNIVWETGAAALLDNVRLTSSPPETVTPPTPTATPSDGDDGAI